MTGLNNGTSIESGQTPDNQTSDGQASDRQVSDKQEHKGSFRKAFLIVLVIVCATVALLAALKAARPEPPKGQKKEQSWGVQTLTVKPESLSPQLRLLGTVQSPYTSGLKAAVSADIKTVTAREGLRVAKGDLLMTLDDQEAQIALIQRKADIADIKAQLSAETFRYQQDKISLKNEQALVDLARRAVQRQSKLKKARVSSESKIDQAKQALQRQELSLQSRQLAIQNHANRVSQLEARLERAQAQFDLARIDLQRVEVKAPFPGVVTDVYRSPGERVRTGDLLLNIYDRDNIEVIAQLPNREINAIVSALDSADTLEASAQGFGQPVRLRLERLAGQINKGAGGANGIFSVIGSNPNLMVGQTLNVLLELPKIDNVVAIPVSALYGADRIYQVVDNRLKSIRVTRKGTRFDQGVQRLLVQSDDIKPGARIITTQLPSAINGLKVSVRKAEVNQ
ncbi:MAG: RND transporter [Proteobacteria bacterium]|nr:MAG: RND transporter [Pseudomonadota bacterium]